MWNKQKVGLEMQNLQF